MSNATGNQEHVFNLRRQNYKVKSMLLKTRSWLPVAA